MEVILYPQIDTLRNFQKGEAGLLRLSRYNYTVKCNGGYLIYNTMYSSLIRVWENEYSDIIGEKPLSDCLVQALYDTGIMVKRENDELAIFTKMAEEAVETAGSSIRTFDITTTMKCNARCPYCFEKGAKKEDFTDEQRKNLIDFIEANIGENKDIELKWFGGEPLLGQDTIDYVTDEMDKRGISYRSSTITNGSLITKELVDVKFKKWNMGHIQITLDGLADTYEKTKNYIDQKPGIFNEILEKIHMVAQSGVYVTIRMNVGHKNSNEILELERFLQKEYKDENLVSWYVGFLNGVEDEMNMKEKIDFWKKVYAQGGDLNKLTMLHRVSSFVRLSPCMRKMPDSVSIDIDGNIYTCERLVGREEEAIGTAFHLDKVRNEKRGKVRIKEKCKKCVFLPKCMGGCIGCFKAGTDPCFDDVPAIAAFLEYLAETIDDKEKWENFFHCNCDTANC